MVSSEGQMKQNILQQFCEIILSGIMVHVYESLVLDTRFVPALLTFKVMSQIC